MPAIAAFAALDEIVLAFGALLLAIALFPIFRPLLSGALSQVPVVGGWIASNVDGMLWSAYSAALGFVSAAVAPIEDSIRRIRWFVVLLPTWTVNYAYAAWYAIARVVSFQIPAAVQSAIGWSEWRAHQAELYANDLAIRVERELVINVANLRAYAAAEAYAAALYANDLAIRVEREVQVLAANTLAELRDAVNSLARYAESLVAAEAARAAALLSQAVAELHAAVLSAELLAHDLAREAEQYARALADVVAREAAAALALEAGVLAAATAAVAARVTAIENLRCIRMCGPLGELGELLQGLEDAAVLGLALELLTEARSDPGAVARDLSAAIVPGAREVAAALNLGIPG